MSGVISNSDVFAQQNSTLKTVHGCTLFNMPAGVFCSRLVVSERTRMSVVQNRSDVFAMQKLASGSVHGRTLPDRLFSKKEGLRSNPNFSAGVLNQQPRRKRRGIKPSARINSLMRLL